MSLPLPTLEQIRWARRQGLTLERPVPGQAPERLLFQPGNDEGGCLDETAYFYHAAPGAPDTPQEQARRDQHNAIRRLWDAADATAP
ncbi:MAG: hypothetical protein H7831_09235 [Magnetococcus sp. WYHC-3]